MGKEESPINVNPGETYTVTYQLKVQPEVYAVMKANSVEIKINISHLVAMHVNRWLHRKYRAYSHFKRLSMGAEDEGERTYR